MVDYDHFEKGKRDYREDRKRASKKDRSRFKKTDSEKREELHEKRESARVEGKEYLRGRVLSIKPTSILVDVASTLYSCTLRGLLKKERKRTSLLVAGDFVLIEPLSEKEGVIHSIEKRTTALSREGRMKGKEKVIAANVDQAIIITSIAEPSFNIAFTDRIFMAVSREEMTPLLVINKMDLLTPSKKEECKELISIYERAGIKVLLVSVKSKMGLEELADAMKGKVSVFVGESGVGKSSLLNACAQFEQKVQEVSQRTQKGVHTTTRTELLSLPFGGWCVDTPGIQIFGFVKLTLQDLKNYFSDIEEVAHQCPFINCTHTHEPTCAVREAVEKKELSSLRFNSYKALLKEIT